MAIYPAQYPRPVSAPIAWRAVGARPRAALNGPAVRSTRVRERPRRAIGAVRPSPTFAVTPLAPLIGLAVFAVAIVFGLVRAVALVPAVDGRADPRRRRASRARIGRTGQRVGLGLAVIVVIFSAGLIYVDRTVQISARSYDLAALQTERDGLLRQERTLENDLARLGSEVAVGHEALDQGLIRLGPPILIPAR